jgi:deoxyxylulose-5-phosphate synthase
MGLLDQINHPADLRTLDPAELTELTGEIPYPPPS